jgi:protein-tyrosine-phosphatase
MAHAICVAEIARRSWSVTIYSGGTSDFTGDEPLDHAVKTCALNHTPTQKATATFVRDLPLSSIDHFLAMERRHVETLVSEYGIPPSRVTLLGSHDPRARGEEIDDPIGQNQAAFNRCYGLLRDCITHYLDASAERLGPLVSKPRRAPTKARKRRAADAPNPKPARPRSRAARKKSGHGSR